MSYFASGSGSVYLKKDIDVKEVSELIEELNEKYSHISLELSNCDGEYEIEVFEENSHWDEYDIQSCLAELETYTSKVNIEYDGEGESWRYQWDNEHEEDTSSNKQYINEFSNSELIKELEKRGYKVISSEDEMIMSKSFYEYNEDDIIFQSELLELEMTPEQIKRAMDVSKNLFCSNESWNEEANYMIQDAIEFVLVED